MSKMIPASVGSVPPEALSKGTLNESLNSEQKLREVPKKLDEGPKVGEKGEFKPASYKTKTGSIRTDC